MTDHSDTSQKYLFQRGLWLEYFTIGWNIVEGVVALSAGIVAGSSALVAFGVDSSIEVISATALLWRLHRAGPQATAKAHGHAERRALYIVASTFYLLAAYVAFDGISSLVAHKVPDRSTVGLVLSVLSLLIMPALAYAKQKTGQKLGSRALQADAVETWVCAYLSLALLLGLGLYHTFSWWWADSVAALAMLPVILWQGWETFEEAK